MIAIVFCFLLVDAAAQSMSDSMQRMDSLPVVDSLRRDSATVDTVARPAAIDTIRPRAQYAFTSDSFRFRKRLFFSFTNSVRQASTPKAWVGKEAVFYSVVGLLLLFAIIKNGFSRYLFDLYSAYFRTTVRQKQIKEQLMQSPLPSLFFNAFFIISTAVFLSLLFRHFGLAAGLPFWQLAGYSAAGLLALYTGKFLLLKFLGWVFQMRDEVDTYIFVVFSTNKLMGVLLLPVTVLLAFANGGLSTVAATLGLVLLIGLMLYRYFLSFISINRQIAVNAFHFGLYLAAFEVLPLLVLNKLLFTFLRQIA